MPQYQMRTYLALEGLDFTWSEIEIESFRILWGENRTLDELARYFKRTQEEILLLALDQAIKGKIKPRKGGLLGVS